MTKRPQGQAKVRILEAARQLFLTRGYSSTNLEEVAAAAQVTKPTVYNHFGSKAGLLQAITQEHADSRVAEFTAKLVPSAEPGRDLQSFADVFLKRVLGEEARRWQRLAITESVDHPDVGKRFYECGPARVKAALVDYLHQAQKSGSLAVPDPEQATEQFLGMLLGLDLMRGLISQPLTTEKQRKKRCRETVEMFLTLYGEKPS